MSASIFFRISPRRLSAVAVLAALAAMATGLVVYSRTVEYEVKGIVFTRRLFPPATPDYALTPFADDVVSSLTTPSVAEKAARASGVAASALEGGLDAARVQDSANVEVVYRAATAAEATRVVKSASTAALEALSGDELRRARATEKQAERDNTNAVDRLAAFESQNGVRDAELVAEVDRTRKAVADARDSVDQARAQLATARSGDAVAQRQSQQVSRLPSVLRGAVSAAVIVAALGLMTVVALDRRRAAPHAVAGPPDQGIPQRVARGVEGPVAAPSPAGQGAPAEPVPQLWPGTGPSAPAPARSAPPRS